MRKTYTLILSLLIGFSTIAQVGINTTAPTSDLHVVGDLKTDEQLYLESPGVRGQIRSAKLLIRSTSNELIKYDIDVSKYGPINFSQFVFENLSTNGLQEYDTKISTSNYIVTVQGYYFLETGTNDPNIVLQSDNDVDNIEGYQIYAFKNAVTGTWCLKAAVNDSRFRINTGSGAVDTSIDLYLNLIIYRNNFITKQQAGVTVNMGNSTTGTAPLPTGF